MYIHKADRLQRKVLQLDIALSASQKRFTSAIGRAWTTSARGYISVDGGGCGAEVSVVAAVVVRGCNRTGPAIGFSTGGRLPDHGLRERLANRTP